MSFVSVTDLKFLRTVPLKELRRKVGLALNDDADIEDSCLAEAVFYDLSESLNNGPGTAEKVTNYIERMIDDLRELQLSIVDERDPQNF